MAKRKKLQNSLGIDLDEFVAGTDRDELMPFRVEMAFGLLFDEKLTPPKRKKIKARVEALLSRLVKSGALLPENLRVPAAKAVHVRDLPKKCGKCKSKIQSPFFWMK